MPSAPTKVVGRRVGALVVDALIWAVMVTATFFAFGPDPVAIGTPIDGVFLTFNTGSTAYVLLNEKAAGFVCALLVLGLLHWVVPVARGGWTVGKLVFGVRVVRPDGQAGAGFGRALVRQLLWIVDDFPYFIPAATGFIVAVVTPGNRRVGDMVADTYVVRRAAVGEPVRIAPDPRSMPVEPAGGQVSSSAA